VTEANDRELPPGWVATSLGAVAEPRTGKADPQAEPNAKFIGMEQVEAHTMRLLATVPAGTMKSGANSFRPGDVLYGRLRSYLNKVYQPDFSGLCSGEFIVLPETCAAHGKFLKYRLNAGDFVRFASRINTGDRPRVDFDQIKTFDLSLPPRSEQERIADALDELLSDLDAGVAALERVRDELKLYRAAVLKAAVEGALTAEWHKHHPQTEPASELLKRILAERRRRWEEEQLRKFKEKGREPPKNWKEKYEQPAEPKIDYLLSLPQGWCWASLDQIFRVERGRFSVRPRNDSRYFGGDIPFVQIGELPREGGLIRTYSQTLNEAGLSVSKRFEAGTVLISIVGATIGNTGVLSFDSCCPDSLVALQSPSSALLRFAELFLQTRKLALRVAASASGGQPNINLEVLQPLVMPLPSAEEIEAIVDATEDQLSIIDHLESDIAAKLTNTQGLRQSILRHAFSGKLVPQDPKDEPASKLLKRIAAEREQRACEAAAAKRLNGQKPHRASKPRGKAARAKTTKKETDHGRISDR
jgi:type I restriction enzyme S subunit